jgi:alpha-tubulin suppressor-like RCC1 family protein
MFPSAPCQRPHRHSHPSLALCLLAVAATLTAGCQKPSALVVEGDGARVTIPAGALEVDVTIGVARVDPSTIQALPVQWSAGGDVFAFTPHHLGFAQPVTVDMPWAGGTVETTVLHLADDECTQWLQVPDGDGLPGDYSTPEFTFGGASGGMVTFTTTSFSYYRVVVPLLGDDDDSSGGDDDTSGDDDDVVVVDDDDSIGDDDTSPLGDDDAVGDDDGDDDDSAPVFSSTFAFTQISARGNRTCGIRSTDRTLQCWGQPTGGSSAPTGGSFLQVGVGENHNCAIDGSNALQCWGDNAPETDMPVGQFSELGVGDNHNCSIDQSNAEVSCWGNNDDEQVSGAPAATEATFSAVSAGFDHTCGILSSDGNLRCWGSNIEGQSSVPLGSYSWVSAGYQYTCAIQVNSQGVACWGLDGAAHVVSSAPTGGTFSQVSAGFEHACAIRSADGGLHCWGNNDDDQLSTIPSGAYSQVSAGGRHTCAIEHPTGIVYCWGRNDPNHLQSTPP